MKKQIGLIVLGACALATLAAAQVPVPPVPPAPPAPLAAPAPPAVAAPVAAPNLMPPVPPAPPALPPPAVAAAVAPQAPAAPAKPARPTKTPEAAQPPEPARAPAPPPPPLAPPAPPGLERGEPDPVNIQFQVTVTAQSGTNAASKRSAILTVSNGTGNGYFQRGMLRAGNSIPVASTSFMTRTDDGKEAPAAKPLTSYNYRSVGLNVDVDQATIVSGNRVRAALNVEFSGVDEKTGPGSSTAPPSFPTFSQRISLYLESGKPVLVAQSTDQATGVAQTVEVKATILR